jgi:4-amino-4-deoxy-L-arabinose transferase-like glycosyltransferase
MSKSGEGANNMPFRRLNPLCQSINPTPLLTARDYWLLTLLTAGALILRLVGLNEGLWYDEIMTLIKYVRPPLQEIIVKYDGRNSHILYSVLAHFSHYLFGESAWSIRLPAALLGTATIPAAYYLGLQLTNRREALLAAVFLLGSYHHVWYSQSARGYSGALFAAVVLSIILIRLLYTQKPSWTTVAAYSVVASLGMWMHLTVALIVLAHGITWFGLSIGHRKHGSQAVNWRAFIAMAASIALCIVPYAGILRGLVENYFDAAIMNAGYENIVVAASPVQNWLSNEIMQALTLAVPGGAFIIPLLLLLLLLTIGAGLYSYARQGWLSWGILTLPLVVVVTAFLALQELIYPRYLLFCTVFLLLIGVRGGYLVSNLLLPSLTAKQTSAIGLTIALASAMMVPRAWQPKQDIQAAHDYIQTHVRADDALVCQPIARFILNKYLGLNCSAAESLDELLSIEAAHTRTWYVYTLPLFFAQQKIRQRLKLEYTIEKVANSTVNRGEIVILLHTNGEVAR